MTAPSLSVSVPLPDGFTVLWAADQRAVDPIDDASLDPQHLDWLTGLRDSSARAPGLVLCAVHAELWRGEPVTASLVVSAQPLDESALPPGGLHEWALDRTSTAGQVSRLELMDGRAVASVDVVTVGAGDDPAAGSAGVVEVHLPEAAPGLLVSLVLTTQHLELLAAYAALTSDIAAGLEVDLGQPLDTPRQAH